ncbi:MAG TPA: sensor histidine kinase, partial [Paenirhodobacter sp.]
MLLRVVGTAIVAVAIAMIWVTNAWLTERFTETTRVRTELRLALYSGNIISELQRTSVVPLLLARDPVLTSALDTRDYSKASAALISAREDVAAASIRLLDAEGRVVGATNRNLIGTSYADEPFFIEAMRSRETIFTAGTRHGVGTEFDYSRALLSDG